MSYIRGVLPSSLLLQRKKRRCHLNPLVWVRKRAPSRDKGRKKTNKKKPQIFQFLYGFLASGRERSRAGGCIAAEAETGLGVKTNLCLSAPNLKPASPRKNPKGRRGKKRQQNRGEGSFCTDQLSIKHRGVPLWGGEEAQREQIDLFPPPPPRLLFAAILV